MRNRHLGPCPPCGGLARRKAGLPWPTLFGCFRAYEQPFTHALRARKASRRSDLPDGVAAFTASDGRPGLPPQLRQAKRKSRVIVPFWHTLIVGKLKVPVFCRDAK